MNILALSYTNIGPFADQTKTVTFLGGSSLVSAPIGSGKSFLFFDGPLFALYKYSSRPMLSRTNKKGAINCIFYYEQQRYLIQRQLKPTKSGNDSVQSRLWTLSQDPTSLFENHEMIQNDEQCFACVEHLLEEIEFTSGRELDDAMKILLPPRELVQSVYLLMQESNHVFELPPAQRILVFKHLFGLIGIDEAKEKLTERKKELTTTLNLLEDNAQANQKFDHAIQSLRASYDGLKNTVFPVSLQETVAQLLESPTLYDLGMIDAEITLQGFSLELGLLDCIVLVQDRFTEHQKQGYNLDAQIRAATTALQELKTQDSGLQRQLQLLNQQTQKATHLYAQLDTQIEEKTKQRDDKQFQLKQKELLGFEPSQEHGLSSNTLEVVVIRIQDTIQLGKDMAHTISLLTQQQTTHQEKVLSLQQDITALDTQIQAVSEKYSQQMYFECDKIKGSCPYVEVIKGSAVRSLKQQQEILAQQKQTKVDQLNALQNDSVIKNTSQQLVDCTQQKNKAGQLLAGLERKQTLAQRDEYQTLKTQTAQLQTSLQTLQSQRESIEIPDPKTLEQKRSLLVEQSAQLQLLTTQKQKELENSQEQYTLGNFTHTQQWISLLQKIHTVLMQVTELIETYREKHQKIQNLKDELKRNKELNTIFSKELMVVALQDFLPSLETVINTFLDEVVDYQIRFLTPESIDDSLELDIEIHDHHGVRQVKSLSGGQRATLKIAWILAVSSLFNGQFLFLDETITSLDAEAVARIGRLLESYMAKRETKLLLVTHASQIQQMEMWDRVVKI